MVGYYHMNIEYLVLASADKPANDLPNLPQQSVVPVLVETKYSK
jgi:hypothetical protein